MNSPWLIHGLMVLLLVQLWLNFRLNGLLQGLLYAVLAGALWSLGWAVICLAHNLFTSDLNDWRYLNLWAYGRTLVEEMGFNLQLLMTFSPGAWGQMSLWPGTDTFPVSARIHFNLFLLCAYAHALGGASTPSQQGPSPSPSPSPSPLQQPMPHSPGNGDSLPRLASGHIDYRAYVDSTSVRSLAVKVSSPYAGHEREKLLQAAALFEYVKGNVNYVPDPIAMRNGVRVQGDYLAAPTETLNAGGGDCDDQALLMASLLSAVGIDNRILFVESPTNGAHLLTEVGVDASLAGEVADLLEGFYAQNTRVQGDRSYLPFVVGDKVWLMVDTTRDYVGDYRSLMQQDFIAQTPDGLLQWHAPPVVF